MIKDKIYFLSDSHLGADYIPDSYAHEKKLVEWLKSIEQDCKELYLVGDILDYWYEYRYVVPRGYVRFFGQLASMSDKGIPITWMIGNHDIWIYDYIPTELGVKVVDGTLIKEILGKKFFISHGDGLGKIPIGFRYIRKIFRNKICQRLYSALHPGLTIPFAHGWSKKSRKGQPTDGMNLDTLSIEQWAEDYAAQHPDIDYIVLGHYHVILNKKLTTGCRLFILGDWINKFSYGVFDGTQLEIRNYY